MDAGEMRRMVEAHDRAWEGWWPTLVGLGAAQTQRQIVGSYPDMLSTAAHIVGSEAWWQARLEHRPEPGDLSPVTTMREVEVAWRALQTRRSAWSRNADPYDDVRFEANDGSEQTIRAWECVVHVITHAHFHRGQLTMQMRQMGLVPPSHHLVGRFMTA